jgi:hypothetical protein
VNVDCRLIVYGVSDTYLAPEAFSTEHSMAAAYNAYLLVARLMELAGVYQRVPADIIGA